jgi:hypothetical protein
VSAPAVPVYSQCGVRFRCEIPLDLPVVDSDAWDVDVRWGDAIPDSRRRPPGEIVAVDQARHPWWYTATSTPDGYCFRFNNCGEFLISPTLDEVVVRPDPLGRDQLLPILLAGTVSAFLLALTGRTVLHASAVAHGGAALAFVGQSGRGKSTMAALMCRHGADLVTDDILVVEPGSPATCIGGVPALRLRPAASSLAQDQPDGATRGTADGRLAYAPGRPVTGALPLAAIVVPSPSRTATAVDVRRVPPADALSRLLLFPRVFGWRHAEVLNRDFAALGRVVAAVPVLEARIPWGPPFDPEIPDRLLSLLDRDI